MDGQSELQLQPPSNQTIFSQLLQQVGDTATAFYWKYNRFNLYTFLIGTLKIVPRDLPKARVSKAQSFPAGERIVQFIFITATNIQTIK